RPRPAAGAAGAGPPQPDALLRPERPGVLRRRQPALRRRADQRGDADAGAIAVGARHLVAGSRIQALMSATPCGSGVGPPTGGIPRRFAGFPPVPAGSIVTMRSTCT